MSLLIPFGKYKNWSINQVYNVDTNYCRWLWSQKIKLEDISEIHEYLENKFKDINDDTSMIFFGKYKQKSLGWVLKNDIKYLDWIKNSKWVIENKPQLAREAADLIKDHYQKKADQNTKLVGSQTARTSASDQLNVKLAKERLQEEPEIAYET